MKIVNSQITMTEQHEYQETHQITEQQKPLTISVFKLLPVKLDRIEISDTAKQALQDVREQVINRIQNIRAFQLQPTDLRSQVLDQTMQQIGTGKLRVVNNQPPRTIKTTIQVEQKESYYESEKMSFSAQGIIKTADGKEINFSSLLKMSREFVSQKYATVQKEVEFTDPLVINFDGKATELTTTKFQFDLDNDGELDQLSFLKSGSGFLALDQNQDGRINNGSELFGTASGNGFADLAQYDLDHNGWIDENDGIYEKLRIWTKDENGQDVLFGLGQKGVGAIYLGNIDTEYSFKDNANQTQGELRKTGLFLKEDGTAGTVQQIDFVV